ncbi:MAG: hypothetical protein ACLRSW_11440 [Christensenellaceae bacterium]
MRVGITGRRMSTAVDVIYVLAEKKIPSFWSVNIAMTVGTYDAETRLFTFETDDEQRPYAENFRGQTFAYFRET